MVLSASRNIRPPAIRDGEREVPCERNLTRAVTDTPNTIRTFQRSAMAPMRNIFAFRRIPAFITGHHTGVRLTIDDIQHTARALQCARTPAILTLPALLHGRNLLGRLTSRVDIMNVVAIPGGTPGITFPAIRGPDPIVTFPPFPNVPDNPNGLTRA